MRASLLAPLSASVHAGGCAASRASWSLVFADRLGDCAPFLHTALP